MLVALLSSALGISLPESLPAWYARGGWLMPLITLAGLALYALLLRQTLRAREASGGLRMVRALIAVLPLLGLLGTVGGVALSMAGASAYGLSAGIAAGGIGQALITTQYALVLALPGLIWERYLTRRARLALAVLHAEAT